MHDKGLKEWRPALIAIGFLGMPAVLFEYPLQPATVPAAFFAAYAVYLADHHLPAKDKITWPLILLFSTAFAGSAWLSQQFSLTGILFYIALALLYVLPLFPHKKRLQDFPRLRVIAIVGSWTGIPLLLNSFPLSHSTYIYFGGISALLLPAVLWSDLADIRDDRKSGRLTWSMDLNREKRTMLILISLMVSVLCFSHPQLRPMLPAPLLYLACFKYLNRHPQHSDWILLWPLLAGAVGSQYL